MRTKVNSCGQDENERIAEDFDSIITIISKANI